MRTVQWQQHGRTSCAARLTVRVRAWVGKIIWRGMTVVWGLFRREGWDGWRIPARRVELAGADEAQLGTVVCRGRRGVAVRRPSEVLLSWGDSVLSEGWVGAVFKFE